VFSLNADLTLIELYLFNPALAKFAEISYCIKQEDSDIKHKKRIDMGGIPVPNSKAVVHHLMPQSFMNWCFNTFDHVGI
jgi:hypothetical protein